MKNFTIEKTDKLHNSSIFLIEIINTKAFKYILDNIHNLKFDESRQPDKEYLDYLNSYLEKSYYGLKKTKYYYKYDNIGRLYSHFGLQNIQREILHTICRDIYYDLDMVNSQIVIYEQYCKKNKINCKHMKRYINKREELLKELSDQNEIDRREAKKIILSILNNGHKDYNNLKNKPVWLVNIYNEIQKNIPKLINLNLDLYDFAVKLVNNKPDKNNYEGCFMHYLLATIEKNCLLYIKEFLENTGYTVGALIHDGSLVQKNKTLNDEIIKQCEKYVLEHSGYKIYLKIKPMNEGFILPKEYNYKPSKFINYEQAKTEFKKNKLTNDILFNGLTDQIGAELFYYLNRDKFLFDSANKTWYFINTYGIWKQDINQTRLNKHIKKTLQKHLEINFSKKLKKIDNSDNKTSFIKKYSKISKQIQSYYNKKNLISELEYNFALDDIYEKLDNVNNNIIGFKNGVYDLENNTFRNADPKEYITCTVGYCYKPLNKVFTKYQELKEIIKTIEPDDKEREYLLETLSMSLYGGNPHEEFYIWIGSGSNGKGLLSDLIEASLGEYYDSADINYFCHSKHQGHANQADPVMAKKKNTRVVITTEPEGGVHLRAGKLKELTGGDTIQVRHLFGSSFNFVPKFTLIFQTNEQISINGSDGGIIRRLRFLKFTQKFVDVPIGPNQHKIDRSLKTRIKNNVDYKIAFYHILLESYNKLMKDKNGILKISPKVKQATQEFLYENNPVKQFIENRLEITGNNKDKIKANELLEEYNEYAINNSIKQIYSSNIFKNEIIKNNIQQKRSNGSFYIGIKLLEKEENEEKNMFDM